MKDNEIIETWQKLQDILKRTENVILQKDAIDDLVRHITNILDLINRQKEEIERLRSEVETTRNYIHDNNLEYDLLSYNKIKTNDWLIKGISKKQLEQEKIQAWKAEAYKEFAERLKEHKCSYDLPDYHSFVAVDVEDIDNLLKEMVGDK